MITQTSLAHMRWTFRCRWLSKAVLLAWIVAQSEVAGIGEQKQEVRTRPEKEMGTTNATQLLQNSTAIEGAPADRELSALIEKAKVGTEILHWASGEAAVRLFDLGTDDFAVHINPTKQWVSDATYFLHEDGSADPRFFSVMQVGLDYPPAKKIGRFEVSSIWSLGFKKYRLEPAQKRILKVQYRFQIEGESNKATKRLGKTCHVYFDVMNVDGQLIAKLRE
jgi:hypothetical protein